MFCLVCQHDLRDCDCPDIEQRLRSLADLKDNAIAPAAEANLIAWKVLKHLDSFPVAGNA